METTNLPAHEKPSIKERFLSWLLNKGNPPRNHDGDFEDDDTMPIMSYIEETVPVEPLYVDDESTQPHLAIDETQPSGAVQDTQPNQNSEPTRAHIVEHQASEHTESISYDELLESINVPLTPDGNTLQKIVPTKPDGFPETKVEQKFKVGKAQVEYTLTSAKERIKQLESEIYKRGPVEGRLVKQLEIERLKKAIADHEIAEKNFKNYLAKGTEDREGSDNNYNIENQPKLEPMPKPIDKVNGPEYASGESNPAPVTPNEVVNSERNNPADDVNVETQSHKPFSDKTVPIEVAGQKINSETGLMENRPMEILAMEDPKAQQEAIESLKLEAQDILGTQLVLDEYPEVFDLNTKPSRYVLERVIQEIETAIIVRNPEMKIIDNLVEFEEEDLDNQYVQERVQERKILNDLKVLLNMIHSKKTQFEPEQSSRKPNEPTTEIENPTMPNTPSLENSQMYKAEETQVHKAVNN